MNGLSNKFQANIKRWTQGVINESQDMVNDTAYGETEKEIENTLHDLYSDAVLDEIYSDIEDLESIGDRELNDVDCIIEKVINENYSKIKKMIRSAKNERT